MAIRRFSGKWAVYALAICSGLTCQEFGFAQTNSTSSINSAVQQTTSASIDSEALATLAAIDQHELDAAAVAVNKQVDKRVMDFAKMMQRDHRANLEATKQVGKKANIALVDTDAILQMKAKGKDALVSMTKLNGDAFSKAYIDAMVKGHQEALDKLTELIGQVQNDDVKAHLTKTKTTVEHHLKMAKDAQDSLMGRTSTGSDAGMTSGTMSGMAHDSANKADNTARNVRDRNAQSLTPLDQGNSKADITRTAQIRKDIVQSDLSTDAKNVKIITLNGKVTLRGPVNSAEEKRRIEEIAINVAGQANIDNQLEVK